MDVKYLGRAVLGFWTLISGRQDGIVDAKEREKSTTGGARWTGRDKFAMTILTEVFHQGLRKKNVQ